LPALTRQDVGLMVSAPFATEILTQVLNDTLGRWAAGHGVSIGSTSVRVRPQHFTMAATASGVIPDLRSEVTLDLGVAAPVSGGPAGVVIYPAVDHVRVTRITSAAFGDLTGLVSGLNTFLAAAVSAANELLMPQRLGIAPVTVPPVDLRALAAAEPGVTVSPDVLTPAPMSLSHTAFLIDDARVMAMADWEAGTLVPSSPTEAPPGAPSFEEYRTAFRARWQRDFGDPDADVLARANVKTPSVAAYLAHSWNAAGIAVRYTGFFADESVETVHVNDVPRIDCKAPLNCRRCKWWNLPCHALRAACELANETLQVSCRIFAPIVREAVNKVLVLSHHSLGDLKTSYVADVDATLRGITLNVAPDLSSLSLAATGDGDARVAATLWLNANSVLGRVLCPGDLNWRFPIAGGRHHLAIPSQAVAIDTRVSMTPTSSPEGRRSLVFKLEPARKVAVIGKGHPPHLEMSLALAAAQIPCPITAVLQVIPGVGDALRFFQIGSLVGTAFPELLELLLKHVKDENVRAIFLGEVKREFEIHPVSVQLELPSFDLLGQPVAVETSLFGSLIVVEATRR
jgi:hypothetical protein